MKTTALITYHSAYNFGSVLQAYATQEIVKSLTGNCEIINYRMPEQKRVYAIYRWDQGPKSVIKNMFIIPQAKQRKFRIAAYEKFFVDFFNLSPEFAAPEEVKNYWNKYDVIISGSDQIWNKHSIELDNNSWEAMDPYLLKGYGGVKISYASSIASLTDEELRKIAPDIKDFKCLSSREGYNGYNIDRMKRATGRQVAWVVDPTFLFSREDWIKSLKLQKTGEEYILYYSLSSWKSMRKERAAIRNFAEKKGLKVKLIAPLNFFPQSDDIIETLPDVGPIEFLNLIYNANTVVTDSYHGTILSVNFGKDVYSICPDDGNNSHKRKNDALNSLGIGDRIIKDPAELKHDFNAIDYSAVYEKLDKRRCESMEYLREALS